MFCYDIKRAIRPRQLVLFMFCVLLVSYGSQADVIKEIIIKNEFLEAGWTVIFIKKSLSSDSVLFLIPLLGAFPFSSGFIEEQKSGIVKISVSRVDKKCYIKSKVMSTALSGFVSIFFCISAIVIISIYLFKPLEMKNIDENINLTEIKEIIGMIFRYSVCGALYAQIGQILSISLNHRYMAWMSPFMMYYLLIIIHERYMEWCYIIYPIEWLQPSEMWGDQHQWLILWLLSLLGISSWVMMYIGMRRLDNV